MLWLYHLRKGAAHTVRMDDASGVPCALQEYQRHPRPGRMNGTLTDQNEFRRAADLALHASAGDHTMVILTDVMSGTTRFANNEVVQNLQTRRSGIAIQVAFG